MRGDGFCLQMGFPSLRKCLFLEVTSRSRAAEPHTGCLSPLNVRVISTMDRTSWSATAWYSQVHSP